MSEEKNVVFNSSYGPVNLVEVVTNLKIEGAGKYTFVQLSDSHIAILSDKDDEDMQKLIVHERNVQWGGGCIDVPDRKTTLEESAEIMREKADSLKPDAVFLTGDIADVKTETIFEYIIGYMSRFESPACIIAGNHDTIDFEDEATPEMHKLSERLFGENRTFTELHFDGFDVLCFSSFFASITDRQIAFLKEKLNGDKPLILFMHAPVYTEKLKEVTGEGFIGYYTVGADKHDDKAKEFAELIKSNKDKIVAVFAGHCHYHIDNDADETDFKQYINTTAFSGFYRIININH